MIIETKSHTPFKYLLCENGKRNIMQKVYKYYLCIFRIYQMLAMKLALTRQRSVVLLYL